MKENITKQLAIHEDARFDKRIHPQSDTNPFTGRAYIWGKHL